MRMAAVPTKPDMPGSQAVERVVEHSILDINLTVLVAKARMAFSASKQPLRERAREMFGSSLSAVEREPGQPSSRPGGEAAIAMNQSVEATTDPDGAAVPEVMVPADMREGAEARLAEETSAEPPAAEHRMASEDWRRPSGSRLAVALLVATVAIYAARGQITHGVDAVSATLWNLVKTARTPVRAVGGGLPAKAPHPREDTAGEAVVGREAGPAPANGDVPRSPQPSPATAGFPVAPSPMTRPQAGPPPRPSAEPQSASGAHGPVRAGPASADEFVRYGEDLVGAGRTDDAIAAFTEAVRIDRAAQRAYFDRSQALAKKGDLEGAIADLSEAIRLDPKDAAAFRLRALAYVYRNDNDRAIADLTSAIGLSNTVPGRLSPVEVFLAYRSRAVLYDVKGLFGREIVDLTQMIDAYWKNPDLSESLGKAWGGGSTKVFLGSIYKLRAQAYSRVTLFDKALQDLSIAIEFDPDHAAGAYNERAQVEQKLGKRDQAISDYRSALKLDPNMKEPKEALARIGDNPVKR